MRTTEAQGTKTDAGGDPVILDRRLCKACGICISLCPPQVFDRDPMGYPEATRPEDCTACLFCELHCPDFALEVRRGSRKRRLAAVAVEDGEQAQAPVVGGRGRVPAACDVRREV